MPIDLGLFLPNPDGTVRVADAAREAERLGIDSLWAGDHLMTDFELLDAPIALAAAATATERIKLGLGVYLPALRQPVWAAKHIATLSYLIERDRFLFGVGLGGKLSDELDEWTAAGVTYSGRAARTDTFLERLEPLLSGETIEIDGTTVRFSPAVPKPPVWIGGRSEAALRRTARYAEGWLGAFQPVETLRANVARLGELAESYGRARPSVGMVLHGGLFAKPNPDLAERRAREFAATYGLDLEVARSSLLLGTPSEAAERIGALAEAGAELVTFTASTPWQSTVELLAETKELLNAG